MNDPPTVTFMRAAARLRRRAGVTRSPQTRAFVDEILGELRRSGWSPTGWAGLMCRSLVRSWEDASQHPRAAAELILGHAVAAAVRPGAWLSASAVLTITHLGLLDEGRDGLGWANRLTLLRANLPALVPSAPGWMAAAALASDWADGHLARRGDETAFGAYADALADVAFWTWYVLRREDDRVLRRLALFLWLGPAAAVTTAYFVRGRSIDYPRVIAVRNLSVAVQVLVTLRALARSRHDTSEGSLRSRSHSPRNVAAGTGARNDSALLLTCPIRQSGCS
jgi:phosphatidylglycerophosphate synthase